YGSELTPMIRRGAPKKVKAITLAPPQMLQIRKALMGVVREGGTAAPAAIAGVNVAGKTGTAPTLRYDNNGKPLYWAWFAGMAPAEDPQTVVRGVGPGRRVRAAAGG